MALVLKIESGPGAGASYNIAAGRVLRVGRTEVADVMVPDDPKMSRMHFEVRFDGESCSLHDLQSTNGTHVNGIRVAASTLREGDVIAAGTTQFSVHMQADAADADATTASEVTPEIAALLAMMRQKLQPLYAVVDTAREPAILQTLLASKQPYMWLFEGESSARLAHFAPYLVPLPADSPLLEPLLLGGWGNNWGIFFSSRADPTQLQGLFRWLLKAALPDGTDALLRFYDPRILRTLLESADMMQAQQLFGMVSLFVTEGDDPETALLFAASAQGITTTAVALGAAAEPTGTTRQPPPAPQMPWLTSTNFRLRADQLALLESKKRNTLQETLLEDMRELYPERFERITEERMKIVIEHGCQRTARYGIRGEKEISQYIGVMMRLGPHFDVDPNLSWAAQILGMRLKPAEKVARLSAATEKHLMQRTADAGARTQVIRYK